MRMNFLFLSGFLVSESNMVMNEKEDSSPFSFPFLAFQTCPYGGNDLI